MIKFECFSCHTKLKAKDSVAGKNIKCPKCGVVVEIPAVEPPDKPAPLPTPDKPAPLPATEKQKDYALSLGIKFSPDITKSEISKLLDIKVGDQIDERYKRLDDLTNRESKAYDEMKEEILANLDVDECMLSTATESQVMEKYEEQDLGAILITFPINDFDPNNLDGLGLGVNFTDNISEEDMKKILFFLGIAAHGKLKEN